MNISDRGQTYLSILIDYDMYSSTENVEISLPTTRQITAEE